MSPRSLSFLPTEKASSLPRTISADTGAFFSAKTSFAAYTAQSEREEAARNAAVTICIFPFAVFFISVLLSSDAQEIYPPRTLF